MSPTPWLPTVDQIVMASERPILAALDAVLELTARTLLAEHPMLEEDARRGLLGEPPPPCQAMAASIVILARTLHDLIEGYRAAVDHIHGDSDGVDDADDRPA
jgi:hypothetical protein